MTDSSIPGHGRHRKPEQPDQQQTDRILDRLRQLNAEPTDEQDDEQETQR